MYHVGVVGGEWLFQKSSYLGGVADDHKQDLGSRLIHVAVQKIKEVAESSE